MNAGETEKALGTVLAETAGIDQVAIDAHFFDELGVDSLVMAQFCARLRTSTELPPISIEDVYRHPTVRALARSVVDGPATPNELCVPPPVIPTARSKDSARTPRHLLCGALQLFALLMYAAVAALGIAAGYGWMSNGSGWLDVYLRSVGLAAAGLLLASAVPVAAKWALIGRFESTRIRIWSLAYVRFWVVAVLIRLSPAVLFAGSPLYILYLRALGAKIGPGAVIFSRNAPVCADLLTVGANAVIRKDSLFSCYRAEGSVIKTGPVSVGANAIVGEAAVLDIDTALGDGAHLAHASSLYSGQAVPDGESREGSPAVRRAASDPMEIPAAKEGRRRRAVYGAAQLLGTVGVSLPLAVGAAHALSGLNALVASLVLVAGTLVLGLLIVGTVPRLLNLMIEPGRTYPLYGLHYAAHRAIGRLTNVRFFTYLFGDSSFIVHYLRWIGYDLSTIDQTGSNFGLEVKHDNPYLSSVGSGTMVADGLSIINADYSSTSFRCLPTAIGARNFVGNWIAYPPQGRTGENCLIATKATVPVDGPLHEHMGLLGAPSFEIPRSVERDGSFEHLNRSDERGRRLGAKNLHNAGTMGLFLTSRWTYVYGLMLLAAGAGALSDAAGAAATVGAAALALPFTVVHQVIAERAAIAFRALEPRFCSIYEPYFWRHERYWKLSTQLPRVLNGTPFKPLAWRALGVRIGRRVFDDGCWINEKTLVTIGDDCALNARCIVQPHSQEDGAFKSDRIEIGAGCTVGVNALVNYGVTIGDGATIAPDSFVMKGTEIPARAHWGRNPARDLNARIASPAPRLMAGGLMGPRRELPSRRFHELFEARAAAHPSAVAATCGDRQLTYGELNARANRLARALLARGLRREEVVAVVTDRNLEWMTAVLAIFKSGGAYLPIEPRQPADRVDAMLSRAECDLVLTETGICEALAEAHDETDLGVEVTPDQLAYVFFTSGSTGEPKGAMCEHAGMLNHLFAKVDDLELAEGEAIAQIAPQAFDISLWQLIAGLLVGARTVIVEQELILDIEGFIERIADRRISVLQVVPSYLEALLTHLEENPRDLPDLRCVSVTGEALTGELARRWFAFAPDLALVNAYGLTETSDDTNHEVMTAAPGGDRVSLGPPINNVHIYIVDEDLRPVAAGVAGEIVFAGVCVGRGYINDPERTRKAFLTDPSGHGRLYRSGDYGRVDTDGKLEFLGRRDSQVKIRGQRIELGEIESALARVPGVRAAAAIVAERHAGAKHLVAFYGGSPLGVDDLRAAVGESLPSYMVPASFHRCEALPLTANGKVDRKALTAMAAELESV